MKCTSSDDDLELHVVIIAMSFGHDCQLLGMHSFALCNALYIMVVMWELTGT